MFPVICSTWMKWNLDSHYHLPEGLGNLFFLLDFGAGFVLGIPLLEGDVGSRLYFREI